MFWKKNVSQKDSGVSVSQAASEALRVPEELLEIDRQLGLSYCLNMEDFYIEMCGEFCNQATEYLPKLEEHFSNCDWKQYAIVAHALKGNSLNIGASNFSKLSLQHELAGKEGNADFIKKEYAVYVQALKALMDKLQAQ